MIGFHTSYLIMMAIYSILGSIQEDRHKVEQFHNLWNSVPKMWNSSPKSGTGPEIGSLFHKLWNSSTICGTAPPKSSMLFQDVEQCATFNCVSHRSGSSHKFLFRIIVMHLVLCKFMVENY